MVPLLHSTRALNPLHTVMHKVESQVRAQRAVPSLVESGDNGRGTDDCQRDGGDTGFGLRFFFSLLHFCWQDFANYSFSF